MGDVLLSQSLLENNQDAQGLRDPFIQAQQQFQSKNQGGGDILSSTPMSQQQQPQSLGSQFSPSDFANLMKTMGIPEGGMSFNQLGKVQLMGRLQDKYGPDYQSNEQASQALKMFDARITSSDPNYDNKAMNQSLASANRTLSALFGGKL